MGHHTHHASFYSPSTLKTPGGRALLSFSIIFSLCLLYGWANFYRDPGSIFHSPSYAYTRRYSSYRESQASAFMASVLANPSRTYTKAGMNPRVCATILTVHRDGAHYLPTTIASLLAGMSEQERADLHLSVFFANTDPSVHPSWNASWLARLVDRSISYADLEEQHEHLWRLEHGAPEERIVVNHAHSLSHCLYTAGAAPWIGIFEDDVIAAEGWFVRTLMALEEVSQTAELFDREWLYLRIFNQELSTGWASRRVGGNKEHWIALAIDVPLLVFLLLIRRRSALLRRNLDKYSLMVICLVAVPAFVVLFFQSGKASLLPPAPGVRQERFGCCAQSLFFPREQVPGLVNFLRWHTEGLADLLINARSRELNLDRYTLYPPQLQHVGGHSAHGSKVAHTVWSMQFEEHNPLRLQREHAENILAMYGPNDTSIIQNRYIGGGV